MGLRKKLIFFHADTYLKEINPIAYTTVEFTDLVQKRKPTAIDISQVRSMPLHVLASPSVK